MPMMSKVKFIFVEHFIDCFEPIAVFHKGLEPGI